jgi:hypothetical protein
MPTPKLKLNLRKLLKKQTSSKTQNFGGAQNKHMHMITIMNPNSKQLPATLAGNHFKYFKQPKPQLKPKSTLRHYLVAQIR